MQQFQKLHLRFLHNSAVNPISSKAHSLKQSFPILSNILKNGFVGLGFPASLPKIQTFS